MTVATDDASLYKIERSDFAAKRYPNGFDDVDAGETFGAFISSITNDHMIELRIADRRRIFNLGYYTWVEQQGVSLDEFEQRRDQRFWDSISAEMPIWDQLIDEFNAEAALK